jgi:hypothetical protein
MGIIILIVVNIQKKSTMQDKDIRPVNKQGQNHGYWVVHHDDGKVYYNGYFINDEPYGLFNCNHPWYDDESIKQYYVRY